jgi:hypothetical protein
LASNTKGSSHPEVVTKEDKITEGTETLVVELVLGSSGTNDL